MQESKFRALVSLLDDSDPLVSEAVEQELCSLGTEGIERLEHAWETAMSTTIQKRLEDLISRIQISHYTNALYSWRVGGGEDLLKGWLILSQIQYPMLDTQKYLNEINRLTNKIWLQTNSHMQDIERLCVVKRQLYTYDRYMGNYQNQDDPENNYINSVLDRHRGNPLSLSALYYLICHKLEIELQVVNFRVYYALRYIDKTQHFYVDAYNNGLFFTPQQVQQFLQKHFNETNVFNYKPLSNIYIILNFIRLLAANYKAAGDTYKASIFEKLEQDIDIKLD